MLQFTPVYEIKVEPDEDGFFHLIVVCEHEDDLDLPLGHQVAEQIYDRVNAAIGPWVREKHDAHQLRSSVERIATGRGLKYDQPYDPSDPKHPDYHDAMADMWDSREGK